ncbi:MAG: hypothetical protein DWQ10_14465, partial [Calditrichaeota bacterium]
MADDDLDFMAEIVEEFLVESNELLEKLDTDLIALEKSPEDLDLINEIFRAAHTFKGTSGFLGFDKMMRLTHAAEDILNRMRKGNLSLTPKIMDAILETVDVLRTFLDNISETNKEGDVEVDGLIAVLKELNEGSAKTSDAEPDADEQQSAPGESENSEQQSEDKAAGDRTEKGSDTTLQAEKGTAADEVADARKEPQPKGIEKSEIQVKAEAKSALEKPESQKSTTSQESQVESKAAPAKNKGRADNKKPAAPAATDTKDVKTAQSVRVPVSRLDHSMNLAGELVLGRNRLNQVNTFFEASMHSMQVGEWHTDEINLSA